MIDNRIVSHLEPPEVWQRSATGGRGEFVQRLVTTVGVVLLAAAVAAAFVVASDVFFLFFAALLVAILLRSLSDWAADKSGIGRGRSFAIVLVAVTALFGSGLYLVGSTIAGQFDELARDVPRAAANVKNYLEGSRWGRAALQHVPSASDFASGGASTAVNFFSTTFGFMGNLLVLVFLSIYLAASPEKYRRGILALVAPARRERAGEVMSAVGSHLKWWLVGRLIAMTAVSLITLVGLLALGVPQAGMLALIAGVLTAVPFFGPVVAAIPALLVALMQGPTTALWVAGVYLLAQAAENYLITPLVQQGTSNLPPVVAIVAVSVAAALFGVLGLVVASPLAVAIMVATRMLYVEDTLGDAPAKG